VYYQQYIVRIMYTTKLLSYELQRKNPLTNQIKVGYPWLSYLVSKEPPPIKSLEYVSTPIDILFNDLLSCHQSIVCFIGV